jgi:hypothetical protein
VGSTLYDLLKYLNYLLKKPISSLILDLLNEDRK